MEEDKTPLAPKPDVPPPAEQLPQNTPSPVVAAEPHGGKSLFWLLGIVVAVLLLSAGYIVVQHHKAKHPKTSTNTASTAASTQSTSSTPSQTTGSASNASLDQDLTNINTGLSQGSQDATTTDNGLNDSQNQVSVPTN